MITEITKMVYSHGVLSDNNGTTTFPMTIGISMALNPDIAYPQYNYQGTGCYRDPAWPWYFQHPPWWSQLFLVPLFALALSLWNGQQLSWVEKKTVIVMVTCAGAAYAGMFPILYFLNLILTACDLCLSKHNWWTAFDWCYWEHIGCFCCWSLWKCLCSDLQGSSLCAHGPRSTTPCSCGYLNYTLKNTHL
jgi:hypothetical protein